MAIFNSSFLASAFLWPHFMSLQASNGKQREYIVMLNDLDINFHWQYLPILLPKSWMTVNSVSNIWWSALSK